MPSPRANRTAVIVFAACAFVGCDRGSSTDGELEAVWGRRGVAPGRLQKPRAMAIDSDDRLYIVDKTARIQVFDSDGKFIREWKTPQCADGKPTGLTVTSDRRLLVADTHYFRILSYTLDGKLLGDATLGGVMGEAPGEFGLVTDAALDSAGNYYVSEYGGHDRIQKFSPSGEFLCEWGEHGSEPGQFRRPQNLAVDRQDRIWVADACNHRIQVFDSNGQLQFLWGKQGKAPGELYYPYDIVVANGRDGPVYVCEYGNHRVQMFSTEGKSLGCWGTSGRADGQLFNPWALVRDSQGRLHVLDTNNHRVQRVRM